MYTKTTWEDKIDGVSDGTELNAENLNNIEVGIAQAHLYGETTNVGNAYSVSIDSSIDSLAKLVGVPVRAKMNADSTDAITLNVNTLGAKAVKKGSGTNFTNAKIGSIYTYIYNGTNFILQGSDSSGDAAAADLLAGKTCTTDAGEVTGTMTNRASGDYAAGSSTVSSTTLKLAIPAKAMYDTTANITLTDADFAEANIKVGVNLFGKTGTHNTVESFGAGDNIWYNSTSTAIFFTETSYTKKIEVTAKRTGTYRITFEIVGSGTNYAYGRIYKNGVAVGTERVNNTVSWVEYSEDLSFTAEDEIQLYVKSQTGAGGVTAYRSFKIKTDVDALFVVLL
jgi:hypothetical protein